MENKPERKWYQKKRYITSLVILGLIVISGLSGNAPSPQVKNSVYSSTNTTNFVPVTPQKSYVAPTTNQPTYSDLSNDNYYTNVSGNTVHSPAYSDSIPAGASAECGDGTYSFSQHRQGTCSHHGGVSEWL